MKITNNANHIFKLQNGEELIAKVVSQDSLKVTVTHPITLMMMNNGQMQLIPTLFGADMKKEMDLYLASVAFVATPNDQLEEKYIEATTGIITGGSRIIME